MVVLDQSRPETEEKERSKELFGRIEELLPKEALFVKAEFEGPDIVVYIKKPAAVYSDESLIKNIAATIKKKIIIRADASVLTPPEKAKEIMLSLIPPEAGINSENGGMRFSPEFSEVYIQALKPGLVIGKGGSILKSIIMQTNWNPKVLRTPTMHSDTTDGVRQLLYKQSDTRKKFLLKVGKSINRVIMKSEWLKATALGGYREVGRSALLLESPHSKIMIDCGLSPEPSIRGMDANTGVDTNKAFPYLDSANISINELDAVVLTHAHMDHIGFLPYLFKFGYEGPVYCTPPTRIWQRCCSTTT